MSRVYSSWTPPNSVCSAIAPATATAMPLTTRADAPPSSCSRRTASCHGDAAARRAAARRLDQPRQQRGDAERAGARPATAARVSARRRARAEQRAARARPAGGSSRQASRRRRAAGPAHDAERLDRPPAAARAAVTAIARQRARAAATSAASAGLGRTSAANTLMSHSVTCSTSAAPGEEQRRADDQAGERAEQRLAGRDRARSWRGRRRRAAARRAGGRAARRRSARRPR